MLCRCEFATAGQRVGALATGVNNVYLIRCDIAREFEVIAVWQGDFVTDWRVVAGYIRGKIWCQRCYQDCDGIFCGHLFG